MDAVHGALASCASRLGATDSKSSGCSSRHILPARVSFANLAELHDALKRSANDAGLGRPDDFLVTDGKKLVYTARIHADAAAKDGAPPPPALSNKRKRRREDGEFEALEKTVETTRQKVQRTEGIVNTEVDAAEAVLSRSVQGLRGPRGEHVLQSHALVVCKLRAEDKTPRLVVALRCMPCVPVSISSLKTAMGGFWSDGAVEAKEFDDQDAVYGKLPSSEEGRVVESHGHVSLFVVTSAASR